MYWLRKAVATKYHKGTQGFQTTCIDYFSVLEVRVQNRSHWAKIKILAGMHFFLKSLGERICFLAFSRF